MKAPAAGSKEEQVRRLRETRAALAALPAPPRRARRPEIHAPTDVPNRIVEAVFTAPVDASVPTKETTMKKRKTKPAKPAAKKRSRSEAAANLRTAKVAKSKPTASKTGVPALEVAAFICRDGGASMAELVKEFGIEAHPMRAKIHYVRHKLGYDVQTKDGRYLGTAPA